MGQKLYFAYGSNTNLEQMEQRCPAARPVCPVVLDGYELRFRGNYGSGGVATIVPREGGHVSGLLWEITPEHEQALDRYEGWPYLYGKEMVTVRDRGGQTYTVMAYVMIDRYLEPVVPSAAYYDSIQEGYRENGLPVAWLEQAREQTVREIHGRTGLLDRPFTERVKREKRGERHER